MADQAPGTAKRVAAQLAGWILVAGGVAGLVLPGPGLLLLVAGLVLLSQQYEWAERRVEPVKKRAFRAAEQSVADWRRIVTSCLGALTLVALGVLWMVGPPEPGWWPLPSGWWLAGGWPTGSSLVVSGLAALVMIGYSLRRFR